AHGEVGHPPGKGCYWDEHELVQSSSGVSIACPKWEWAELDGKRLVWAAEGRLEVGQLTTQGLVHKNLLFNFNEMTFSPIEAPYWPEARKPQSAMRAGASLRAEAHRFGYVFSQGYP